MGLVDFIGDFASVAGGLEMIPGPSSEAIAKKVAALFSANIGAALEEFKRAQAGEVSL